MNWYVFSTVPEDADETLEVFNSYAKATLDAQCTHCTESRPKRVAKGMYKVSGENHSSWVVSRKAMRENGFENLVTSVRDMKR
jgi:hypothetical protein